MDLENGVSPQGLEADNEFLTAGGVFTTGLIETWCDL